MSPHAGAPAGDTFKTPHHVHSAKLRFQPRGQQAVTVTHCLPPSLMVPTSSRASSRAFSLSAHKKYKRSGGWPTGAGMELKDKCPDLPSRGQTASEVPVMAPPSCPTCTWLTAESLTVDAHVGLSSARSFSLLLHSHLWDLSQAKCLTHVFVSASVLPRGRRL